MNQANPTSQKSKLSDLRVAFIKARWHADIVDNCEATFLETCAELGISRDRIEVFEVPGAYEIPLLARKLASSGAFDGVAASAFVVDGGIYHHEFVSSAVIDGMMRAQLDSDVPVFSAVLTPHNFQETEVQIAFFRDHFKVKGRELAEAVAQTLALHQDLNQRDPQVKAA
ncbi:6,7-dimethyl-8-ribityllumazine synthase [Rhodovibrionaceae bacterium A322]